MTYNRNGIHLVSYSVAEETVGTSFFGKETKAIKVLYGIQKVALLGYRAVRGEPARGRLPLRINGQLSPKWRKTQQAAENDLASWMSN